MQFAIIGYGKMGKAIESIILDKGYPAPIIINNSNDLPLLTQKKVDVAIEFSRPNAVIDNLQFCIDHQINVVSGTTGWLDKFESIAQKAQNANIGFLYASNFSIGVNIFFEINRKLASLMNNHPNYKASMKEIHHTQKLDSPSGTAISLANDIIFNNHQYTKWEEAEIVDSHTIKIDSERQGSVPGTHIIYYQSEIDTITIAHEAHNRIGFASGAVLAAEWLAGKSGLFSMKDVLGI